MQGLTGLGSVLPSPVYWELVLLRTTLGKPDCRVSVSDVPVLLHIGLASLPDGRVAVVSQSGFPRVCKAIFWPFLVAFRSTPLKPTREVCNDLDFVAVARLRWVEKPIRAICGREGIQLARKPEQTEWVLVVSCPFINKVCWSGVSGMVEIFLMVESKECGPWGAWVA